MPPRVRLVLDNAQIRVTGLAAARELVAPVAQDVLEAARVRLIPHTRSGRLARSLRTTTRTTGLAVTATVGTNRVDYALYLHAGTRSHVIRPGVGVRALKLGPDRFAAYVNHPGTRPVDYLTGPLRTIGTRAGFIVTETS